MTGSLFPNPGDLFQDRYRIASVIGSGGFARVVLAHDVELDRKVALKILKIAQAHGNPPPHGQMASMVERFRREARLVAKLRDPHTITMFDHGQTGRGLLYMVCEYVDGHNLREVVEQQAPVAAERVVHILEQALASLQEAHAFGVLHRDIKPANIMLYEHIGRADQVKVLDFGIAKSILGEATQTAMDLTADGKIIGTPRYMSPEQLRGGDIGPPTDIYSLGLVAYELLTGERANDADSTINIITRQVTSPSFRLSDQIDLPTGLRTIVDGMLVKAADKRFQSADEVLDALQKWDADTYQGPGDSRAEDSSTSDVAEPDTILLEAPASEVGANGPNPVTPAAPGATSTSSRKGLWLGAAAAVIALAAAAGVWFTLEDQTPETHTTIELDAPVQAQPTRPESAEVAPSGTLPKAEVAAPSSDAGNEQPGLQPEPPADQKAAPARAEPSPAEARPAPAKIRPAPAKARPAPPKPEPTTARAEPAPVRTDETSQADKSDPTDKSDQTDKSDKSDDNDEKKEEKPSFFDVTGGSL